MKNITKTFLEKLYYQDKKSIRKIAEEFELGKTTIEYYFKKFNIKRRTKSSANKIRFLRESNWIKGLNKEKDERVDKLSKKIRLTYKKKRYERLKKIEQKFGKTIKELIKELYLDKKMSQEKMAKEIGYGRKRIIDLMKEFKILKRPKYQYISSLKGKDRPMFGKKWNILYGKKKADERRKIHALRFRELTIKRLNNNEFPFFDTSIELLLAKNLIKEKIPFVKQLNIDNKFSCDFAVPFYKIIIECDGDYWHANPKIYNRKKLDKRQKVNINRDLFKDKYLSKKGWVILRFFESEIKSNVNRCIDKIKFTIVQQESKKIKSSFDNLQNLCNTDIAMNQVQNKRGQVKNKYSGRFLL